MTLELLIATYGYLAIALGAFLEGETVLVLGGLAAHQGYLDLFLVMFYAFIGTFIGDQFYFYLGRTKGSKFLEKKPHWKEKSKKIYTMLEKHELWVILGFRFLYGLRTVTPLVIGTSKISFYRFFILNALGGIIWTVIFSMLGYIFGQTIELFIEDIKKYEVYLFGFLVIIGLSIWLFFYKKERTST